MKIYCAAIKFTYYNWLQRDDGGSLGRSTYAYDNVGNLQSFAYPNGVMTAYTYDQLNRLTQMGAAKDGTL